MQFWVTWALVHIMIWGKLKDLEKAMTDFLNEYELDNDTQEKILQAKKEIFLVQG